MTTNGKPQKQRSAPDEFTQVAKLARRLTAIAEDERAELAKSPEEIKAKYAKKRHEAVSTVSDQVRERAYAMLSTGVGANVVDAPPEPASRPASPESPAAARGGKSEEKRT